MRKLWAKLAVRDRGTKMRRRDVILWLIAGATAAVGAPFVSRLHPERVPDQVASFPAALVETPVKSMAAVESAGRHLGFDTSEYPGDDAMETWKRESPYEWVGYYLPAPCHKDASWAGKRETLAGMGWGVAVVYVGQQTWGQTPGQPQTVTRYVKRRVRQRVKRHGRYVTRTVTKTVPVKVVEPARVLPGQSCSPHLVSGSRGTAEAIDAINRTEAEGFPRGTVIFLDVERMENVPTAMRDYYKAWVAKVIDDGRYRPGIYVHTHNAVTLYKDVKGVYQTAGKSSEPPFWIAGGSEFDPEKLPTDVGHAFAAVWQGILDKVETRAGVKIPIDVNVASLPSPSAYDLYQGD